MHLGGWSFFVCGGVWALGAFFPALGSRTLFFLFFLEKSLFREGEGREK